MFKKSPIAVVAGLSLCCSLAAAPAWAKTQRGVAAPMCRDLIAAKNLRGDAAKAEFNKCMSNPQEYK